MPRVVTGVGIGLHGMDVIVGARTPAVVRLALHLAAALALLLRSLALGNVGYTQFERLSLLDALLNSAMLLGAWGR